MKSWISHFNATNTLGHRAAEKQREERLNNLEWHHNHSEISQGGNFLGRIQRGYQLNWFWLILKTLLKLSKWKTKNVLLSSFFFFFNYQLENKCFLNVSSQASLCIFFPRKQISNSGKIAKVKKENTIMWSFILSLR